MKKRVFLFFLLIAAVFLLSQSPGRGQGEAAELTILDEDGQDLSHLTDGDTIRLRLALPEAAEETLRVSFELKSEATGLAECLIPKGETTCETEPLTSLGWYWSPDGSPQASREVSATAGGTILAASQTVSVSSRPVVMVHGFSSSWEAWANYLGPEGYLETAGIPGYAVGDGQVAGTLNTGRLDQPTGRTNTIAENAAILRDYINEVLEATGAQKVDLLAHSMGGLISRYYIDRFMEDEVAQLIMLGSPMAGTECANLPASLGFYLPAALEIQPLYVTGIFNPQITYRKGLSFHALAGVPIQEAVQSPCTPTPTDLAVSLESVAAIPLDLTETPVLHTELNTSAQVFGEYVLPLLQTSAGEFPAGQPDPPIENTQQEPLQFSRIYSGHLERGETREVTINIETGISVASFALYDSSQSLETVVRGASGNIIQLDSQANGLIRVEDPASMLHLGYGFEQPRPGAWKITLQTTERTPESGSDYALTAVFQGGARLQANSSVLLARQDEPVQVTARLALGDQALPIEQAQAEARLPDGSTEEISLAASGDQWAGTWTPRQAGLTYIQIEVSGRAPDSLPIDRTAFLVVETQPGEELTQRGLALVGGIITTVCSSMLLLILAVVLLLRWRKKRKPA